MNSGLTEVKGVLEKIIFICKQYDSITKVVAFGSRARGTHKRTSDIDLCLFGVSEEKQYFILDAVDEMDTHYSLDILFFENLDKETLKESILRDQIVIYEREGI